LGGFCLLEPSTIFYRKGRANTSIRAAMTLGSEGHPFRRGSSCLLLGVYSHGAQRGRKRMTAVFARTEKEARFAARGKMVGGSHGPTPLEATRKWRGGTCAGRPCPHRPQRTEERGKVYALTLEKGRERSDGYLFFRPLLEGKNRAIPQHPSEGRR